MLKFTNKNKVGKQFIKHRGKYLWMKGTLIVCHITFSVLLFSICYVFFASKILWIAWGRLDTLYFTNKATIYLWWIINTGTSHRRTEYQRWAKNAGVNRARLVAKRRWVGVGDPFWVRFKLATPVGKVLKIALGLFLRCKIFCFTCFIFAQWVLIGIDWYLSKARGRPRYQDNRSARQTPSTRQNRQHRFHNKFEEDIIQSFILKVLDYRR